MNLKDFKEHISNYPNQTNFNYGVSKPFSWRGSYDKVGFSIVESPMTREEILVNIELAYTEIFSGYKGGDYEYSDYTTINFEGGGNSDYTDGEYVGQMIAKIEGGEVYLSQEERLIKLAFCQNLL